MKSKALLVHYYLARVRVESKWEVKECEWKAKERE
jgi:hypothetical protein